MTGSPGPGAGTTGLSDGSAEMFGPYRLTSRLGRGGMGEVHRAYDTRRDREVALKRLAPDLADDPEIRERFERECRTAARLSSPHVVPIHDFGVIDGRLYLDMRLVEGRDLARLLREEGPLDPARAVGLVEQLADALDDAHAHDLVHRDVKPGNVLVTTAHGRDFVHLVDFGIVRLGQGTTGGRALTEAGTTLGTLAYMAPEQFEGATVDRRADVYALAVVLYEILVGRPPFDGDMPAMLHQHLNVDPQPPSSRRPGLPPALDAVVLRGLAKRPGERFADAGELAAAARAALDGRAPAPIPDPPGGRRPEAPPVGPGGPPRGPEHHRETWVGPAGPPSYPPYGQGPYAPAGGPAIRWDSGPHASGPPPSGPPPSGPWSPTTPAGPPGKSGPHAATGKPRRRGLVIGLVAVAVLLVAAIVVTAIVVLDRGGTAPATLALGEAAPLSQTFTDSARPGCLPGDGTAYQLATGAQPQSVLQCQRGVAAIAYIDWPTAQDAQTRVASYQTSPSTDGIRTWTIDGITQGPYYQTLVQGQCTTVASYTGHSQMVQAYVTNDRCADVTASLNATGLPTTEDLRAPERVFPGAIRPGCNPGTPTAGTSGVTPKQVRGCAGPEGTTVSYTRWNTAGDVSTEANARGEQSGGAAAWNAPSGGRLGPLVQTEDGGPCRTFVGWDAVAYSIEVAGPSCEAVDRAVTALAPPPLESLPA